MKLHSKLETPLISIIVPVYNLEVYIENCIQSILNQTFKDFELIIVDDGSEDATFKICKELANSDQRISCIKFNHVGVSSARNEGIKLAKGKFIAFIDGDDMIHPNYLKYLYTTLKQKDADIVIADYKKVNQDFKSIEYSDTFSFKVREITQKEIYTFLFDDINYMTLWGKLYKKSIIGNQRFNNFSLGEDVEFNTRVYSLTNRIFQILLPIYFYRNRFNSAVTSKFNLKKLDNVNAYEMAYYNLKLTKPEYSHFALIRLYKNMLSVYYISPYKYKKKIIELNKNVWNNTFKDFINNKMINPFLKIFLISSIKFPIFYKLFRQFMEWKTNVK